MENIQDYIESGILEQYALGELSAAEQAAVEAQAASHPEIRAELEQVQAALGFYAEAHAITPPAAMRERVLNNVLAQISGPAATSSLRADVDAVAQTASRPAASTTQPVAANEAVVRPLSAAPVEVPASRSGWAIAASVALLLSLGGNMLLYSNWKSASSELVALQNEQARFATTSQVVEKKLGALQQENQVLRNDEFRAVALAGTKTAPTAHARVLFNPATHKVYVDVRSLPPLPADKQYQLWALDKGKPIDAGVLTVATATGEGLQHMKDIASAQTFAMTVEPAGGSAGPTLSTMTVVGNI
ncbi:anti-sigma factor [Microvirga sp. STS02]|uniref:anti-sigma factor n=1 Tax=Hymenobacter negativus TaxID=2795026 RepID=UPI0018DCB953|nr:MULTISPECIES: anti-sigma factor [Bacteria]MBH8569104.1 anti-sigma factor [Hymenobacter negativus]MBR7208839.1 anti-sigma factor [Microvirga sp. STS02]